MLGTAERVKSGFDPDGKAHASLDLALRPCPACGEPVHLDAPVCGVCGQALPWTGLADLKEIQFPARTSGKALACLILGCASFLLLPGLAAAVLGHRALSEIKRSAGRLKGRRLAWSGLALGYLGLLGVPAWLLFSGVHLPWHDPALAKEDRAITSLRMLDIALQAYAATYGNGFPESLSQLGPPTGQAPLDSNSSGFVSSDLASGRTFGYGFTYVVTGRDATGHPNAYAIRADPPASASPSLPHFFTDQTQVIRVSQGRPATYESPAAVTEPAR